MTWWTERGLRTGPLDELLGRAHDRACRLGEALDAAFGRSPRTVCASRRLARRVIARGGCAPGPGALDLDAADSPVVVHEGLRVAALDLRLLADHTRDTAWTDVAAAATAAARTVVPPQVEPAAADPAARGQQVVLVRDSARWHLVLPHGTEERLHVPGLCALPVDELRGLLDELADLSPAGLRLGLTAEQCAAMDHPLLDDPRCRVDLQVGAGTSVDVVAQLVRRRTRLGDVELALGPDLPTVTRAALLAGLTRDARSLRLVWSPTVDAEVRERVLPQAALAFRGQPVFTAWTAELETATAAPFAALTSCRPRGRSAVVTTAPLSAVPRQALPVDGALLTTPHEREDWGQRELVFDSAVLPEATTATAGPLRVALRPYAEAATDDREPVLQRLATADDLALFLQDADRARREGRWRAPLSALLESECAWSHEPCAQPGHVLYVDERGVRSSRLAPPLTLVEDDLPAALDREQAQLAERRGCAGCPVRTHCSHCSSVPVELEAAFCAARRERPWLPAYVTALRLRQRYGSALRVSGFGPGSTARPATGALRWVVARDGERTLLAEVGGRRRVYAAPDWAGDLVDDLASGADRERALAADVARGRPVEQVAALLDRLEV